MRKAILIIIAVVAFYAQAEAEDDYTLKDWCKPFRPKACFRMMIAADDGFRQEARREAPYCISDTDKAVDAHPECSEYLRGFRDRTIKNKELSEQMWRSQDDALRELHQIMKRRD